MKGDGDLEPINKQRTFKRIETAKRCGSGYQGGELGRVPEVEVAQVVYNEHGCLYHRQVAVVVDVTATPQGSKSEAVTPEAVDARSQRPATLVERGFVALEHLGEGDSGALVPVQYGVTDPAQHGTADPVLDLEHSQPDLSAERAGEQVAPVKTEVVEHCRDVTRTGVTAAGRRVVWLVRAALTTPVEQDHPARAPQRRLGLPA